MSLPSLALIERSLWFCNITLSAILVARFIGLKLVQEYRFFLSYLVFNTVRSVFAWSFTKDSAAYRYIWAFTQPVVWVLYVLVVLELCALIFKEYRGIQALGRWTVLGSLSASIFLSTILVLPTWMGSSERFFSLQRYFMVERGIDFALVLLLLLLLAFLVIFPIQLSRNVIVHSVLYSIFFMSGSIGLLILNLTGYGRRVTVSTALIGISVLCLIGWITLVSRAGETKMVAIRSQMQPADEERLIGQLASINATLLRASKKANPPAFSVER
jgi:hypothetical protein